MHDDGVARARRRFRHHAEVDESQAAVRRAQKVARVRVCVEKASLQQLAQRAADADVDQAHHVQAARRERRGVAELDAVHPLHRHHAAAARAPMHRRHQHVRRVAVQRGEALRAAALRHVVQLAEHLGREGVHSRGQAGVEPRDGAVQQRRPGAHDEEVQTHGSCGAGALHLDGHRFAVEQLAPVHLAQRGCSHWLGRYAPVHPLQRHAQLCLDQREGFGVGEARQRVLQLRKLRQKGGRHQVRPRAQRLAQLDERGAQARERAPQLHGASSLRARERAGGQVQRQRSAKRPKRSCDGGHARSNHQRLRREVGGQRLGVIRAQRRAQAAALGGKLRLSPGERAGSRGSCSLGRGRGGRGEHAARRRAACCGAARRAQALHAAAARARQRSGGHATRAHCRQLARNAPRGRHRALRARGAAAHAGGSAERAPHAQPQA